LDQDPYIAQILEEELEGYQVVVVKNVSEVPGLMHQTHSRAIVLNLAQKSQAWQQMLELGEQLGNSSVPVILCPLVSPQHLGQALGLKDYLIKTITREGLVALLERLDGNIQRILMIDDDPRMGHLLMRLLQTDQHDYEFIWASNGHEGLKQMQDHPPDLVLMDLSMPHMDGYTLLAQMQKDPHLGRIPVAAITAHTSSPEEERWLGGKSLFIANQAGFTNREVLNYLGHILNAAAMPLPLQVVNHQAQGRQ
jgi:CheY-like chemotaxis protein